MRLIIPIIAKQLNEWFPESKISATRFNGNYEYGQFYVGELDGDVSKQLMDRHWITRDIAIIYNQNPLHDQTAVTAEFNRIRYKMEDFCCHIVPMWHHIYFDVFQSTMTVTFEIWERYHVVDDSISKLDLILAEYPKLKG